MKQQLRTSKQAGFATTALIGLALCGGLTSRATSFSADYLVNKDITDSDDTGLQDTHTIVDSNGPIESVQVSLQLTPVGASGGWIGDLYAYLRHSDSSGTYTSILLNRIGRTLGNSAGLGDSPVINITLTVSDPDIHLLTTPLGANLNGSFGADGRLIDPANVLDTDPRTAGLGIFNGTNPSGDWTLFVADLSGGNQYRLDSWQLQLESKSLAVPESTNSLALLSIVFASLALVRSVNKRSAVH
jgi:subtilisin-like proprotein convertase family protein